MTGRFTIPADHPCLSGHFPGRPIVPAVVVLDEVFAAAGEHYGERVANLSRGKFLRPLQPETPCEIVLEAEGDTGIGFRCTDADGLLAHGRLELDTDRDG